MIRLLLAACMLIVSTGCITHRATVAIADAVPTELEHDFGGVVVQELQVNYDGVSKQEGPLPLALPVSAWRRLDDGTLTRAHGVALTPRPWWQRFPMDLATDLMPTEFVAERIVWIVPQAPQEIDDRTLTERARQFGYASRAEPVPAAIEP